MSLSADTLRLLQAKGLSLSDVIEVAAALEADFKPVRSGSAERMARKRERDRNVSQSDVTCDASQGSSSPSSSLSPTPPILTTSSPSPKISRRAGEPDGFAAAFDAYPHVKQRKSRSEALKAFNRLPPAEQTTLAQAARAFAAEVKPKDADFVPAMQVWLNQGLHLNYGQAPPANENRAACIKAYRTSGIWHPEWGEKPGPEELTA